MYNNFDKGGLEMSKIKNNALGVILCLAIAMPAYYLGKQLPLIGGPVFAILMGSHILLKKSYNTPLYY